MGNPNQDLIDGMRAAADWLEKTPLPRCHSTVSLHFFPADLGAAIKGMGSLTKRADGNYLSFRKTFSDEVYVEWCKARDEVCERVVTGTKTVFVPIMQQIGTETKTVEEFEWRCPESILAALKPQPVPEPQCDHCGQPFSGQAGQSTAETVLCPGCVEKANAEAEERAYRDWQDGVGPTFPIPPRGNTEERDSTTADSVH